MQNAREQIQEMLVLAEGCKERKEFAEASDWYEKIAELASRESSELFDLEK